VSIERPVTISSVPVPFGLEQNEFSIEEEGGGLDARAGSHPFQLTSTLVSNQVLAAGESQFNKGELLPEPVALPKDINVKLPVGLVGNPDPIPRCSLAQFFTLTENENSCSPQTAVGVATVLIDEPSLVGVTRYNLPLFNVEPSFGEPARFGFYVPETETPVFIDTSVRGGPGVGGPGKSEEYAITASSLNTTQTAGFLSSEITFWGVPGDPRHDNVRGWNCLHEADGLEHGSCLPLEATQPQSFLTLPTRCTGTALETPVELDSWEQPLIPKSFAVTQPMQTLTGCNRLPFEPAIAAEPTIASTASPSGLKFELNFHDENLTSAEGLAQSQMKSTVVTLPEGFTVNPSAGVGLAGCTEADLVNETLSSAPGEGCPDESKLGTVEAETPLLSQKLHGNIFIAQPYENPFHSLIAGYIVLKNPETGILIKLPAKVTPNSVTGQLVTSVENEPQFPISHFEFHFREGSRAPLITPATCRDNTPEHPGSYTTEAALSPWSGRENPSTHETEPGEIAQRSSSFTITSGAEGGPCPSGSAAPFNPGIEAGTQNNNAGSFSPFYLHLTRHDADQEISGFSTSLPPGLTGSLTGIPFCPEAAIQAARSRTGPHGGAEEEANPSCPAASQIGHTLVGTGVGAVLAYVPGKIYLAGPYNGTGPCTVGTPNCAPFSIVSVTSAKVGPFDLGTVVLRFGLSINPYTAQVSVSPSSSEPIPYIIKGIVAHVRDIRVYIERPNNAPFTLNPTSCSSMSISSTLNADEGAKATVTSPFQAASCANLKFAPDFKASTQAHTSKSEGASLHVDLTYPYGPQGTYADIAKVKVELPKQLPSRLTTLQKACTAKAFETNPASCPPESAIGTAKAVVPNIPVPLEGPVYFVSHGGEAFPSLEIVLQGYGVEVILVGATFISKAGITSTTFKAIPDNPVNYFELTFPEKKYSALAANGNLCTQKLTMPVDFTAQNGAEDNYTTTIATTGCGSSLSIVSSKVKKKTLTLSVYAPAAGKVTTSGKGVSSGIKTYSGTEALTFNINQKKAGKLKTKIKLTFTPSKGKKQSKTVTVEFKK
jgi:hypothetical protein